MLFRFLLKIKCSGLPSCLLVLVLVTSRSLAEHQHLRHKTARPSCFLAEKPKAFRNFPSNCPLYHCPSVCQILKARIPTAVFTLANTVADIRAWRGLPATTGCLWKQWSLSSSIMSCISQHAHRSFWLANYFLSLIKMLVNLTLFWSYTFLLIIIILQCSSSSYYIDDNRPNDYHHLWFTPPLEFYWALRCNWAQQTRAEHYFCQHWHFLTDQVRHRRWKSFNFRLSDTKSGGD